MNKHEEPTIHQETRTNLLNTGKYLTKRMFNEFWNYTLKSEATEKELDLYRKLIGLMVCVPQNETYQYVVRYTDDVKFSSILNQINNLSKVGEDK